MARCYRLGVELRIDELAQQAQTTSRNIRAYQARGLIPPPRLVGRTGYYGEEHLRRLEVIAQLQERGFSLEAIRQTLDAWSQGGDLAHLIGFSDMLSAPYSDEQPGRVTAEELLERFPEAVERPELIDQAVEMGLIIPAEDGYEVPSPLAIDAGAELAAAGVPLAEIFDLVKLIRTDVADIARRFVDLVGRYLVEPLIESGGTPEQIASASAALERLRPIAVDVVRPFLATEMRRVTDERVAEVGLRINAAKESAD